MRKLDPASNEHEDFSVMAFVIDSPCGRTFRVPFEAVQEDYVDFLVRNDGLSRKEALGRCTFSDLKSWFYEQFSWAEVDSVGECIGQPTPAQIQAALNRARGGFDSGLCTLVVRDDLIAQKKGARLEEALPGSPQSSRKPGPSRF